MCIYEFTHVWKHKCISVNLCQSHGGDGSKYELAPKPAAGSEIQVGLVSRNPYNRAVAKLNKQAPSKVISINPLDEDAPL